MNQSHVPSLPLTICYLGMPKFPYLISFFGHIHDLEMVICSNYLFAIISSYLCAYHVANPSFKCRSLGVFLSLDKHTSAIGREEKAKEPR